MKSIYFILVFFLLSTFLNSLIINVPADQPTIQGGINVAVDTDTVLVQPGTYVENINYNGKLITVASLFLTTQDTTYISQTVIDGNQTFNLSVVTFESGEDFTSVLSGFTFTNGLGSGGFPYYYGGGISCLNSSSPSLVDIIVSGNTAITGGGIYCVGSNPSLVNVTISDNMGHGIYCISSNPSLTNVTITGNYTEHDGSMSGIGGSGGGIYCSNSSPSLVNVVIIGNSAVGNDSGSHYGIIGGTGGGIYCRSNSIPSLTNVTISGNHASYGGGIFCYNSSMNFNSVDRCNIFLNFAGSSGCDLYAYGYPTINIIVDTFTVLQPDEYFAYPIDNFTFDILNAKVEQANQDLYVSPDGSDDNSGLTVDDPLLTVSFALVKINPNSTNPLTIHLSNGIYSPSGTGEIFPLYCRSYVSLLGVDEASTILDGEELSGILYCRNDNHFSIENMTIKNGSNVSGSGGIYCHNSSPNLENVTLINNNAIGYNRIGGGICCQSYSSPNLQNVTITNNSASYGGGISCTWNSSPILQNVTISGNSATDNGGGIYCHYSSNPSLQNVTISDNSATDNGGGIYCHYSSNPSLQNVTISDNSATDNGGGIYCSHSSNPSLINSILWNDSPQEIYFRPYPYDPNSITISYSDIQGGEAGIVTNNNGTVNWLEGNINEDPLFVGIGDYHLTENSPCIDAGDLYSPPDPDGTRADMGAYYFHQIGAEQLWAEFYADTTNVYIPLPAIFHDLSIAFNTEITTWLWDFDNDGTIDSYEQNPSYTYQNFGYYSVSLTVEDDIGNSNTMVKTDYIVVYSPAYSGHTFHIDQEGSDELGNGSPEYPFATIQHGISIAANSDTVLVHPGTYFENINYNGKNLIIGSLFLTTQDTTYISQTIINGNSIDSVVKFETGEDSTAVLNGFTITNGGANHGGGISCYSSSPSLVNIKMTGNSADVGGGISCSGWDTSPSLVNVSISDNSAGYFGGGIYCYDNSSPCLENVTIIGNSASGSFGNGGGIYCNNSSPSLTNVAISGNTAVYFGGGIYCRDSNPELVNCILWNDIPQEIYFHEDNAPNSITISYSDIQGGEAGIVTNNNGTVNWLEGNIDEDPLFVGTGEDPYSLLEGSPCIDAGIPDTTGLNLPPWDIIGNLRIWDGDGNGSAIIDMGAYEFGAPPYVDVEDNVIVQTPEVFLQQNYPNPFNPTTTINYSLKENSKVSLNIYNIKGQKVKQLISDQLPAGQHSVVWAGRDDNNKSVSSGIYFYKLKTANFEKTRKMILMK